MSKFRPPRRSGWRAPWVSGVLAVLIAAALAGAGAAAGAQEAPAGDTATTVADPSSDSTAPATDDTTTDTTAAPDDTTDTTEAADTTDTTEAADDAAEDPAADPNGNANNLPLNSGIQTGTVFNDTPYGEIPAATPQVLVLRPGSGRIIPLNREIQLRARFSNFRPGTFSDPASEYGKGTQRLDENGFLNGHNHACIQPIARDGSVPGERCASFVVMQQEGTSDILTGIGPPLTEPGRYRVCIDAAAGNHYPAARAFAQRGGPVDCVRVLAMSWRQLRQVQNAANQ
ncbi:MAG TPA: hypothetical protein VHO93_02630 [Actinomycetota bacterium]|nr:hypothetical protein [Actinomycetota bacterium]